MPRSKLSMQINGDTESETFETKPPVDEVDHDHDQDYDRGSSSTTGLYQRSPASSTKLKAKWEPGCQPDEVYDQDLPPWRAACRRWIMRRLRNEQEWMPDWQKRVRTPARDGYFYWSALFGTTTFFMTFLPMFFFFGYPAQGRRMLHVVGLGIYTSSVAKDLVCTPRPYSPPVVRLSMSTHHREYGFPSSHSTNTVSIAILLGQWLFLARESVGVFPVALGWALLLFYASSVVGGRLYTGMHSVVDIVAGSSLGFACWLFYFFCGESVETWVGTGHISIPIIMVALCLVLVHYHPETVDDCPCFEDTIATLSAELGVALGHWYGAYTGCPAPCPIMSGNLSIHGGFKAGAVGLARLVIGIALIFAWRIFAKAVLLSILPPIFRSASSAFAFTLPTRRFYTAATDYHQVPTSPLRAIPSFIDLHSDRGTIYGTPDPSGSSSPVTPFALNGAGKPSRGVHRAEDPFGGGFELDDKPLALKRRKGRLPKEETHELQSNGVGNGKALDDALKRRRKKRHYDAEVLTKIGVYTGIGIIASSLAPRLFEILETAL